MRVETETGAHDVDTGFVVFNDRNYPRFERLLARLERPVAAVEHELLGQRREPATSSTAARRRTACSPSARTSSTPSFHRMIADLARFNRDARALLDLARGSVAASLARERGYSHAFVERLIVPQVSAVWSADPAQMWSFPARFLVEFFDNHGMLGFRGRPRWRTIRGGSRRYVDALIRPIAPGCASTPPSRAVHRHDDHVAVTPRGARPSASTRSFSPCTPTRRWPCSPTPPTASTSSCARSRTRPTRRCCTTTAGCFRAAAAPGRAGTTTSWPSQPAAPTVTYHMNRLQSLDAGRELCVTLNRTEPIDPGRVIRRFDYAHPIYTAARRRRAGAPRRDQRPPPDALLRRLLGLGLPRGRHGQRRAGGGAARGRAAVTPQRRLRGHDPPPPRRGPPSRAAPPDRDGLSRPRRASAAARRPAARPPARRPPLPARATTSATPASRSPTRCAPSSPSRREARPTARSGCCATCARSATASTR